MSLSFETLPVNKLYKLKECCNDLMAYQKSLATIKPELFDAMNFESRLVPSVEKAIHNHIIVAKDDNQIIGYAYVNISPKETYSNEFATFFDLSTVSHAYVGCLSQFYIHDAYRKSGVGSKLFSLSMEWLEQHEDIEDIFIFVSNGNTIALEFYKRKGFKVSHDILEGFITVLRN
ncbi:GNAT family N-acetyltransferase [Rossellomorea aquimaris]|uniref:GNAT family N-acetyltransferase n=1 Tax=Rossellomorea aquimaris TaxID=189382 RepID=UPI001CD77A8E|nr:GNAT family N-acetyltransferase [Rossellomorea aquimaris]MCA1053745.1 GNAT family N-acetyltransferase [Rossellomorea aquimaris]